MRDFEKFVRDRQGVSPTTLSRYASIYGGYINPTILEERKLNVTQMDVFSRLMQDRIIFLGTEIDSDVANIIMGQLLWLQSNGKEDITMMINSPGGLCYDGLAIYDTMKIIDVPIIKLPCRFWLHKESQGAAFLKITLPKIVPSLIIAFSGTF